MRVILAACLNCPVSLVAHDETGAAGAAMIVTVSIGLYSNMAECARRWIAQPKYDIVNPDSALARTYEVLFPAYREAYASLPSVWRQMHAARLAIQRI